ncbi:unnamed protein product [Ilex paraguariensis]|uniref:SUZ domain-containing protein n=1 Tax=Ilex paraguariensis TaxID=185542 RepID=A0ABC8V5E5_9AQUA
MVLDNFLDGQRTKIVVRKLAECRYPSVCLSDIPAKLSDNEKHEQIKIVIRPRPGKDCYKTSEIKCCPMRTMEERKEEYDRARARIFSSPSSSSLESVDTTSRAPLGGKNMCFSGDEREASRNIMDSEKNLSCKDSGTPSRVAIFRDREKDRIDPDYDRSYERYVKSIPTSQSFGLTLLNMHKFQPPFVPYDSVGPQLGQMTSAQASLSYRSPVASPFGAMSLNQASRDAVYMQWQSQAIIHAQSSDQFRHAVFQAPFCQQPLSFDYSQNY